MEYSFDVTRVLREVVTVWDKKALMQQPKDGASRLRDIIDKIGVSSAKVFLFSFNHITYYFL